MQATQISNLFPENSLTVCNRNTDQNKTKQTNITRKNGKLAHRRKKDETLCWWFFLLLRTNNNYLASCCWSDFATYHLNRGSANQFHHFGFAFAKKDIIGSDHVRRISNHYQKLKETFRRLNCKTKKMTLVSPIIYTSQLALWLFFLSFVNGYLLNK